MMPAVFKGKSMRNSLVVLVFATLLPAWAQSQGQTGAKAQLSQSSAQAKARASADLTARLQARAIAEAQSLAPMQPLPAWTEVQPMHSVASAPPSLAAAPTLSPVDSGLAEAAPVTQSASDPMTQDLAIAQQIHQGLMPCEMGASVRVEADTAAPGYFHVQGKGFRYRMYPVRTSTGALRLEDKKAGAVWLQLANKSMLMDQKKGRRVADECAHPKQVAYGQGMKTNPPPSLFDKTGMGRPND